MGSEHEAGLETVLNKPVIKDSENGHQKRVDSTGTKLKYIFFYFHLRVQQAEQMARRFPVTEGNEMEQIIIRMG